MAVYDRVCGNTPHRQFVGVVILYMFWRDLAQSQSGVVFFKVRNDFALNCQLQIGQKLFSRIASFKLNGREITERAVDAKIIEPMNIISEFKF